MTAPCDQCNRDLLKVTYCGRSSCMWDFSPQIKHYEAEYFSLPTPEYVKPKGK